VGCFELRPKATSFYCRQAAQPTRLHEALYGRVETALSIFGQMPNRRLEDSIRELCAAVIAAKDRELEPALSDLKLALHEHTERLRKLAAVKVARRSTHY
jgi:hypothetical protein